MALKRKTPLKAKKGFNRPKVPMKKRRTLEEILRDGMVKKASTLKPRSKNNEGWWSVALEIWEEREHKCAVYGYGLGDVPQPIFFSHLLPRGSYRKYKCNKENIVLKSPLAHEEWHKHGPEILQQYPEWKKVCALYFELRDKANNVKKVA